MKMERLQQSSIGMEQKDCLDSDFFTLDPNLAPALRITYAGGTSAAQAQPERGNKPRKKKG